MRLSDYFARLTTNGPDTVNLEVTDEGELRIHLDSEMLPGVTVDTYQTFSGDSWTESELDYIATEGVPEWLVSHPAARRAKVSPEWGDFDWDYDNRAILHGLSEAAADDLVNAGGCDFPQIITGAEVAGVWSPRTYNFATDSFTVWLTLDTDELVAATDDVDTEALEGWARDVWCSRDGFHSRIPRYFEDEPEWATVWASIAWVLIDSEYDGLMAVAEAEHEVYAEHVTMTPRPEFYTKVWEATTGRDLPTDEDDEPVEFETAEELEEALEALIPSGGEPLPTL